jgi:hypothetical protein
MPYNLIPFPISILFIVIFGLAWIMITWKLRKKGRFYSLFFKLSLFIIVLFFVLIFYSIIANLVKPSIQLTPTPYATQFYPIAQPSK